jgi:hypothetical protein
LKILFLILTLLVCNHTFSQDTLFINNELEFKNDIVHTIKIDSMYITVNNEKIKFHKNNSLYNSLSDNYDVSAVYIENRFYFLLKNIKIEDNLSYLFDLHLDKKHFEVFLPGDYILKGSTSKSSLFIKVYKVKKKFKFWKREFYGYTFGTYIAVAGPMFPSRKKNF